MDKKLSGTRCKSPFVDTWSQFGGIVGRKSNQLKKLILGVDPRRRADDASLKMR